MMEAVFRRRVFHVFYEAFCKKAVLEIVGGFDFAVFTGIRKAFIGKPALRATSDEGEVMRLFDFSYRLQTNRHFRRSGHRRLNCSCPMGLKVGCYSIEALTSMLNIRRAGHRLP